MIAIKRSVIFFGLGLIAGPVSAAEQLLPYTDAEAVARGKELYSENCAACHGANLEGQPDWQSTMENGRRPAPPHDADGHTWHHADALLVELTTLGVAAFVGRGYESDMIGFGEILTEQEILDTLAYIKSTWPKRVIETHNQINEGS